MTAEDEPPSFDWIRQVLAPDAQPSEYFRYADEPAPTLTMEMLEEAMRGPKIRVYVCPSTRAQHEAKILERFGNWVELIDHDMVSPAIGFVVDQTQVPPPRPIPLYPPESLL